MTKKIMSVAALVAILGTGAQAFDTNTDGDVLNRNAVMGTYNDVFGQQSTLPGALNRSMDTNSQDRLKGDAIIFPAFKMGEGWETEFVFRNNHTDRASVVKVVVYSADDSSEVVDFNVYLSGSDQVRFTALDGSIRSTDDSIVTSESWEESDETKIKFADEVALDLPVVKQDGTAMNEGYAIAYAMVNTVVGAAGGDFHHDHRGLWKAYRNQLDAQRPGWMDLTALRQGVYTESNVTAPNIDLNGTVFTNPNRATLSGTERMINTTGEVRDLLIPVTALTNYTADPAPGGGDRGMLWAPGEYAAIADRCLTGADATTYATYNAACVLADTATFEVSSATYTYENAGGTAATVSNKIVITQPTKRFLVQLGEGGSYWSTVGCNASADAGEAVATGRTYGFYAGLDIRDETETTLGEAPDGPATYVPITSPANYDPTDPTIDSAYCTELVEDNDIELVMDPSTGEIFAEDKDGFVEVSFRADQATTTIPAIITQMTASRVNGTDARTNWVYAPSNRSN